MKSPVSKLLVLTLTSHLLAVWFTFLTDVLTAKEVNMQNYTKYTGL